MKSKPNVLKSTLCVVPCFASFLLVQALSAIIIALVLYLILMIPIIGNILGLFLSLIRGESPTMLATTISVIIAYCLTTFIQNKMMKNVPTKILSRRILGVILLLIHIVSLVYNLIHGANIYANVVSIMAGIAFIFKSEEE